MEPVSNTLMDSRGSIGRVYCTPPPYHEFHQIINSPSTTASAMDILCEFVNGESDISFMQSAHEKASFLDILYCSGNEPKANDVEMLDEQQHGSNNHTVHFNNNITTTMHQDASPELHHFKLPLLEQEPESSITNSQLDENLKNKEIRRNLERCLIMKQGDNLTQSVTPLTAETSTVVEKTAIKQEKPEARSTSFNAMSDANNAKVKKNINAKHVDNAKLKRNISAKYGDNANIKKHIFNAKDSIVDGDGVNAKNGDDNEDYYELPNKKLRVESSLKEAGVLVGGETSKTGPRMMHISVERNRRKQMNDHLAILRSLMPGSYVQRSDQASIIGGVVEFIKELQQLLASLEAQKRRRAYAAEALSPRVSASSCAAASPRGSLVSQQTAAGLSPRGVTQELVATSRSLLADVEVKLAGGAQVLFRMLSHKAARGQLLQLVAALECLSLQILHLNITTLQQAVLYTFTLKIGIDCRLSVDDLANVVQQIFKDIHSRQ